MPTLSAIPNMEPVEIIFPYKGHDLRVRAVILKKGTDDYEGYLIVMTAGLRLLCRIPAPWVDYFDSPKDVITWFLKKPQYYIEEYSSLTPGAAPTAP